jgi:hypothetical protein
MRIFTASIIAGSLMLVGGLPAAGQSNSPAAPVPLAAGNETTTDRDSYTHRATGEMQDWQQKVQDFGEKAKAKGQEAGDATATAVNSAWARTQAAGRKLQEAGADGWEGAKASYEQATHKLADAWDKVRPEDK